MSSRPRPGRRLLASSFIALALALPAHPAFASDAPKYGPSEAPRAVPLSIDRDYLRAAPAPDFWALMPHYVPQYNGAACSAASVAMLVNAAVRSGRALGNDDRNVTQDELLDRVDAAHWRARMRWHGWFGKHGLTLAQLGEVTEASLKAYGAKHVAVHAVAADGSAEGLARFRAALEANERSAGDVMLVHFLQDEVTGAPGGPFAHISPVGAYDAARRRVLVLDVDREWYEPYWVADDVLWRAMSRTTKAFGAGGSVLASFAR